MNSSAKLAFVIPWYGPNIPGGAENLCREWAEHLAQAGFQVEVLTTTIKEFQSNWNESYHRLGKYRENGVLVRRFSVRRGDHSAFNYINEKLLRGARISPDEESKFLTEGPNSDCLIDFIAEHRAEYIFFFIPYLFGTTYFGSRAAGDRTVLIPCLHDESYARITAIREMFTAARGLLFNSHAEQSLAEELYDLGKARKLVLGMGLDTTIAGSAEDFRRKFCQEHPFVLYVGRKDRTKNTDLLVKYFLQNKRDHPHSPLQLLLVGKGNLQECGVASEDCLLGNLDLRSANAYPTPDTRYPRPSIRDLGFLDPQDKYNAYAAATLLCNPSTNESFSIILMESWLCGTPVLVNSACAVTRDFVKQSQGGLFFSDFYEFEACLDRLLQEPDLRKSMATSGSEFVRKNFSWDTLIARFSEWLKDFV